MRHLIAMLLLSITLMALDMPKKIEYIQDPKEVTQKIMEHFVKTDFEAGLELAKKYWVLPNREIDNLGRQIKRQWDVIHKRFGRSLAEEFIKSETLGKSFIRYYYLQKFENHAIYWRFTFYRSNSLWQINEINFKDDLNILFE
ncbi:MAG: hypothetical protein JXQ76_06350 [Campylobacterales bacterium]|nr:hypothetical protein [Campylobacterales bacterium]